MLHFIIQRGIFRSFQTTLQSHHVLKSRANFSTNEKQSQNQTHLINAIFPALGVSYGMVELFGPAVCSCCDRSEISLWFADSHLKIALLLVIIADYSASPQGRFIMVHNNSEICAMHDRHYGVTFQNGAKETLGGGMLDAVTFQDGAVSEPKNRRISQTDSPLSRFPSLRPGHRQPNNSIKKRLFP